MEFFLSPGFGGAAAVVAAVIAYAAARWRGKVDRRLGEAAAWWDRTRWALDQTREEDRYAQLLGWNSLATLVETAPTVQDADIIRRAVLAARTIHGESQDTHTDDGGRGPSDGEEAELPPQ